MAQCMWCKHEDASVVEACSQCHFAWCRACEQSLRDFLGEGCDEHNLDECPYCGEF